MRSAFVSHITSDDRCVAEMESFLRAAGFDDVRAIQPGGKFWPGIVWAQKLCGDWRITDAKAAILSRRPAMPTSHHAIFISYRRRDSIYAVERLDEQLKQAFGADAFFRDVCPIRKGQSADTRR